MKLGKYTLIDRISHGGMAEVFRAKTFGAAGFERIVAIKLLLPDIAMDSDFVTMLIDEAKIAGQLSHANIAQIFDLGIVDDRYYIVQEYVSGLDLRRILRRLAKSNRKLSVAQSVHIILKTCEGLEYAHNRRDGDGNPLNLVHRDVSPQNILISAEGEIKLIDFGIAKAEGRATQTLAGLIKGKFAYMSPEQIRGLPVDRRSDVFATGIVLHELLTNRPLFARGSEFETLKQARSGTIDPPSKLNPDVPLALDAIVLRALARHVEDRYASSVELRDALWEFSRASGNFYSRTELAAWMSGEIAEEESTANKAKIEADKNEDYPLIEVSDEHELNPTVVDLNDVSRESAKLSGEMSAPVDPDRMIQYGSPANDPEPSVEVSSELNLVSTSDWEHPKATVEERPTLLFESPQQTNAEPASNTLPKRTLIGSSIPPTHSPPRNPLILQPASDGPIGMGPPPRQGSHGLSPPPHGPRPMVHAPYGTGPQPQISYRQAPMSDVSTHSSSSTSVSSDSQQVLGKQSNSEASQKSSTWLLVLAVLVLLAAVAATATLAFLS